MHWGKGVINHSWVRITVVVIGLAESRFNQF